MSLVYFLGMNDGLKRKHLFAHLFSYINKHSDHHIFYIVPENTKFDAEYSLLQDLKYLNQQSPDSIVATTQIQVTSFKRLAWYFLQDDPVYQQTMITDSGMTMLMRQVLREERDHLQVYRGECEHNGFIRRMVDQVTELRKAKIVPDHLKEMLENGHFSRRDMELKLYDLWLIYQSFEQKSEELYIASEDILSLLTEKVKTTDLTQMHFVIDHYDSFSAAEIQLVAELASHANELWLTLLMDEPTEITSSLIPTDPQRTYQRLEAIKLKKPFTTKIFTSQEWLIEGVAGENVHPKIQDFLSYWKDISQYKSIFPDDYQLAGASNIQIWEAEDAYTEILHIGNKIKQIVATTSLRYRDFQILTRDFESYELVIKQVFTNSEIPYFVDQSNLMSDHPFIQAVEIILHLVAEGAHSQRIIQLFRTEIMQLFRWLSNQSLPDDFKELLNKLNQLTKIYLKDDQATSEACWRLAVDILENSVLAYGVDNSDWISEESWVIDRQIGLSQDDEEKAEQDLTLEEKITDLMHQLYREFIHPSLLEFKTCETGQDLAEYLYQLILKWGIDTELMIWRDRDLEQGKIDESEASEQVWTHLMQLLDEYVTIFGREVADIETFVDILSTGFQNASYSLIPPTMDQVQISHFDRSGIKKYAGVFILGMDNMTLPQQNDNKTILSDEDRQWVCDYLANEERSDIYLAPSATERSANENFLVYKAFNQAKQFLILSYAKKDNANKDIQISPYLEQMSRDLQLKIYHKRSHSVALKVDDYAQQVDFIGSHYYVHEQILLQLRQHLSPFTEFNIAPFWQILWQKLRDQNNFWQNQIYRSLKYQNIPENLRSETVKALYGRDLYLSVSQIESYYADPYSHFLTYGLRLKPRLKQELTPLEIGGFYHEALDQIISQSIDKDLLGENTQISKLKLVSRNVLDQLMQSNHFLLFQKSKRMNFIGHKLGQDVWRTVWTTARQSQKSSMHPVITEVIFGPMGANQAMQGLVFSLDHGGKLYLRGKIDRIDQMTLNGNRYLNVIDYKSSAKSFSWSRIYSGLMMQLIVYLQVATNQKRNLFGTEPIQPAGLFYSEIQDPLIKAEKVKANDVETALFKEFRYSGYLIAEDEKVVEQMDKSDYAGGNSPIYPLRKNGKDELLWGSSHLMTTSQWNKLATYIEALIVRAGNAILSGELSIEPYEGIPYIPTLNKYKAIAQFDALLPENNYRQLKIFSNGIKKARDEFFESIDEQINQRGEDNDESDS